MHTPHGHLPQQPASPAYSTMQRTLKFIHIATSAAFLGSLAAAAALAVAAARDPAQLPALRGAIAWVLWRVSVPAVLLLWVSGALAMLSRQAYMDARWVWVKLVAGSMAAAVVMVIAAPAADLAADLARRAATGQPVGAALAAALAREALWTGVAAATGLAAMALGVWRPRLGGR